MTRKWSTRSPRIIALGAQPTLPLIRAESSLPWVRNDSALVRLLNDGTVRRVKTESKTGNDVYVLGWRN